MNTLDAITAGRTAHAGVARPRAVAFGGRAFGMYPCDWRHGVELTSISTTALFTDADSHKAWRPTEHSP